MSTDRIIRWRLLIEEFGPTFLHIKGEKNVIADALSRLDADFDKTLLTKPTNESMTYIFLRVKDIKKETDFPLSPIFISKYQRLDKSLKRKAMSVTNQNYSTKTLGSKWQTLQTKMQVLSWNR
jgi:hypothetical protein